MHHSFKGLSRSVFAVLQTSQRIASGSYALDWLKAYEMSLQLGMADKVPPRLISLGGIKEHFAEELISPLAIAENNSAAACKARFDLSNQFEPATVKMFGLRLWQASSELPLERLDWRMADAGKMVVEFSNMAIAGGNDPSNFPYVRFASALSQGDLRRSPVPFGSQTGVLFLPDLTVFETLIEENLEWDSTVAGGLCFAMMMYGECHKQFGSTVREKHDFEPVCEFVLNNALTAVTDPRLIEFVSDWRSGTARLFLQGHSVNSQVEISDILQ